MRAVLVLMTIAVISCACRRAEPPSASGAVDLTQNVTVQRNPEHKSLAGFEKKWREFISPSDELARPVTVPERTDARRWEPSVMSECVFSADAGGAVPQVTLAWADDTARDSRSLRFDLAIVRDGFARNQYSSAIPGAGADRFLLPSTSALVKNEEAVLLTGPGLFARMTFAVQTVPQPDTGRSVATQTLVLKDLSPGLSYSIRLDHASPEGWIEHGRSVFLTPVCPRGA